jgi:hypothetical protein
MDPAGPKSATRFRLGCSGVFLLNTSRATAKLPLLARQIRKVPLWLL